MQGVARIRQMYDGTASIDQYVRSFAPAPGLKSREHFIDKLGIDILEIVAVDRPRKTTVADLNARHHEGQIADISCRADGVIVPNTRDLLVILERL